MAGRRKEYDPHGPARAPGVPPGTRELSKADVDQRFRRNMQLVQNQIRKTLPLYQNIRAESGFTDGLPRYILSDHRFKDYKFPVSWLPPSPRGFMSVPKGTLRPWQFVAFHCFGDSYDLKGTYGLRENKGLVSRPVGEDGHDPNRFYSGMRYLTEYTESGGRQLGIHFGISRRGDFVSSVDLNDIAWATGGDIRIGFRMNFVSIGFELESHMARYIPGKTERVYHIYRQPYPEKQLLCLAVALRKLNSWRPVVKIEWRSTPAQITSAYRSNSGGCITHNTISTKRTDPGAQFNIPAGTRAAFGSPMWNGTGTSTRGPGPMQESGWDQLARLYPLVRPVNVATECFKRPLTVAEIGLVSAAASLALTPGGGRTLGRAAYNRLAALSRSQQMQAQSRRTLFGRAAASSVSLSKTIARTTAASSRILKQLDISNVKGVEGAVMFNEETGLWEDGIA